MANQRIMACVLSLALTASFAGCQQTNGSASSSAAAAGNAANTAASGDTIKIGFVTPLTGSTSSYGQSSQKGLQLLEEQVNKEGGINGKKIQIISVDSEGKAATAVTAGQKLINDDKVCAIVGPVLSGSSNALAPICQQYNIPMITGTGTNENITTAGDCIFRTCFTDPFQGKIMAKFATEKLKAKTAAILYDNGSDYSKGLAEAFKSAFTGKIVDTESYNSGDKDFNAQLTKIAPYNPDVLFLPEYYEDVAVIAKTARSVGIKATFIGGDGFDSPKLFSIGGDAVEGVYFSTHYSADDTSAEVSQFVKDYKAKYGGDPDAFAALTYDAGKVLVDSIKKAGSTDGTAIKTALKNYSGTVVCGKITFDKNRNAVKAAVIIKTENGKGKFFTKITV
jgi:branched-chain amino acid transport system substrate-binding protein